MERLQEQRDNFRVNIRKKQHLSMLSEKRFKMDDSTPYIGVVHDKITKLLELIHNKNVSIDSVDSLESRKLEALRDLTKLTLNSANVNSILQNKELLVEINAFLRTECNGRALQTEATWIWANLSTEAAVEQVSSLGVLKLLLDCFVSSEDNKVKHNCIWSFNNFMVSSKEVVIGLLQSNFLSALESMLHHNPTIEQLQSIVKSIALMASEDTPATYIMFRQFLKPINQMLNTSEQRLHGVILCCLSRFCRLPFNDIFISDMKARRLIKPLLTLQKAIKEEGLYDTFLTIIQSYAINSQNNSQLLNNNVIQVLDQMLRRTFQHTLQLHILFFIQRLLHEPQTAQKILTSALFSYLKTQSSEDEVQVRFQVIKILTLCVKQLEPTKCMCMNKVQEIGMILKHFFEVETHESFDESLEGDIKQALQHIDSLA